ncbi:MAG: hypothetical protein KAH18_05235 [Psychromonas sp.]|nr:hypothetical protein [Psychromonas sp.]
MVLQWQALLNGIDSAWTLKYSQVSTLYDSTPMLTKFSPRVDVDLIGITPYRIGVVALIAAVHRLIVPRGDKIFDSLNMTVELLIAVKDVDIVATIDNKVVCMVIRLDSIDLVDTLTNEVGE